MLIKPVSAVIAVLSGILFCGCSTFNSEWRDAAQMPAPTNDIAGRWEGRWHSNVNGHNDKLRALIRPVDANHYDVKFRAAYKKWITIHFGYTVRMNVIADTNGSVTFRGSEDLGFLAGGVYTYAGHATPTNFYSTYDSKYDRGTFQMERPDESGRIPIY
jgi:hypothetical protein